MQGNLHISLINYSRHCKVKMKTQWAKIDNNTMISQNPAEKGIPHFYADLSDLSKLLFNFDIENIEHKGYFSKDDVVKQKHYYINARKK